MNTNRYVWIFLLIGFGLAGAGRIYAWSSNGHQTVGAIADALIKGHRAEQQVKTILGPVGTGQLTLSQAAVWPDCVRGVNPNDNYKYEPGPYKEAACAIFENPAGIQEMVAYAMRNNSNCEYDGKNEECHKAFHFADVAIEHNDYRPTYHGTSNYDVVHAIGAAIAVLRDQPVPAPFQLYNKKVALMLIAHLVGDLHQPLHVSAIYLDANGKSIDPDKEPFDPKTDTHGGNSIGPGSGNLQHQWDETKFTFSTSAGLATPLTAAKAVKPTVGAYTTWPTAWATDSISLGRKSFMGLHTGKEVNGAWPLTFDDQTAYSKNMVQVQTEQVAKAGARLAALLMAIWPD